MGPFMVLVGPNGAGKTNIVRALELFGEIIRRGTTDPVQEQGYDQIIRREQRPARSGLSFRESLWLPQKVVAHSLFGDPNKSGIVRPVLIKVALTLSGSISSEDVRIEREEMILHTSRGELSVKFEADQIEVKPGKDQSLWR